MVQNFPFAFDSRYRLLLRGLGVTPARATVAVDDSQLQVRFGHVTLKTPRANIRNAEVTGPHTPLKAIGIRTSLRDRGLTFGSSAQRTTCIRFIEPVRAEPFDIASHPALTVSVEEPERLAALLNPG